MRDGSAERERADGGLGGVPDEELREWVGQARAELAGQPPGGDPDASATRVAMALWLAELEARQGDPRDLDAAIAAVEQALGDDPGHVDAPLWRGVLGQLLWHRYEAASDPGMSPRRQAELLVEPVRQLEAAAAVLAPGEEMTRQVRARLGVAYGLRYSFVNDPADLDAAIAELGEALDGVPGPMDQSAFFRFHYGQQFAGRYDLTGVDADCDRALAEVRRAVEDGENSTECGDGWFPIARVQLARILLMRLPDARAHRDRRAAALALAQLDHLPLDSPALAELPVPLLRKYGMLLCERAGEQTRSEDASRALAVLRQVAERWPVDAPDRWTTLMSLAAGWQLVGLTTLDAEALRATEDAYTDVLAVCPRRLRHFIEATRGYVREVRVRAGHLPDVPGDPVVIAGRQAASALREAIAESGTGGQGTGEDGAEDLQPLGLTGVGSGGEDLQRVIERCAHADAVPALRRLPLVLLAYFAPFLGESGMRPTAEVVRERIRAAVDVLHEDDPVRASLHMVAGQAALNEAGRSHDLDRVEAALEHFDIALAMTDPVAEDAELRGNREVWRVNALTFRAQVRGTQDALAEAAAELAVLRADPSVTAYTRVCAAVQHALVMARRAFAVKDAAGLAAAAADLRDARDRLPADDAMRSRAATMFDVLTSARRFVAAGAEPPPEHIDIDRLRYESVTLSPGDRAETRGLAGLVLGARVLQGVEAGRLDDAIALLEEALAPRPAAAVGGGNRFRFAQALALLRLRRYRTGGDVTDLDEALRRSEEAVRLLPHPGHFGWAMAVMQFAEAHRSAGLAGRGDRAACLARGREAGLRALRGHAWQVLLQSRAQYTTEALSFSASDALSVARWCIADGCPDEAVQALDAGRGLVLHAASAAGTVPERLVAAGRPDLAAEWRTAAGADDRAPADGISGDLRYRALRVLAGTDDLTAAAPADGTATTAPGTRPGDLLTPPSLRDIATALRRTGADAMVYLVPGEGTGAGPGGSAVTVHADGRTSLVFLGGLTADAGPLTAYLGPGTTPGNRDMGPADGAPPPSADGRDIGRRTLEDLCDWASRAVLEPLLAHLRAQGAAWPPRVVLVPMGHLAAVPWHAARRRAPGGRYRYAVQDAVISYAASARLFCEVVAREPVPLDAPGLVVGDPGGDLPHAGREAAALHAAFYRTAPYLGRHETGASAGSGTPAEVLGWLRLRGLSPGGVLHLACHADVPGDAAASTARLHLAGGTLAAEQLTERAQHRNRPGRLGLVSLAACTTHVSGRGYDEAFTLSTAFLVEGARSVLGSLWPVPDEATSYLMFMVHHYLNAEGARPAVALRLAQLWMLDPDRRPPATMPPELARQAGSVDPDDLRGWAGFTHLGQ
ncbi:CHAT domain-containing protein [Streptomyces sp. NPDC002343]